MLKQQKETKTYVIYYRKHKALPLKNIKNTQNVKKSFKR